MNGLNLWYSCRGTYSMHLGSIWAIHKPFQMLICFGLSGVSSRQEFRNLTAISTPCQHQFPQRTTLIWWISNLTITPPWSELRQFKNSEPAFSPKPTNLSSWIHLRLRGHPRWFFVKLTQQLVVENADASWLKMSPQKETIQIHSEGVVFVVFVDVEIHFLNPWMA